MTEEIDSIVPVGASSSTGFSGGRADVIHAPQPVPPSRSPQRPASAPIAASGNGAPGGAPAQASPVQAAASLQDSVDRINARLASSNRVFQLRIDPETGITVAEIKNSTTGQVLQQIPSADVVRLAEMLSSWAHGKSLLVDLIA